MTETNYRTIKKYLEMQDFNEKRHEAKRPNKSDILRPIISRWIKEDQTRHHKQRHTASRIYNRLAEEHSDILEVSERTVRKLVKEEKEKVFGGHGAYLKLEHPGGEAQIDFGEFRAYENGTLKVFHELILSFPKSNAGYAVVTRSQTREALLEGLTDLFKYIGVVPSSIWFDRMSSAALRVKDEKGQLKSAELVSRFSSHYGFNIKFCNPNSGHEKGSVENKVGTIRRRLFVPEPDIKDLDHFNTSLLDKCSELMKKPHYRHKVPIEDLFNEEKSLMKQISKLPFDSARYESRKVNKYGQVEFSGSRYSVSPKYVGLYVNLKIKANSVIILSKDLQQKIDVHPRLFEKGQESIHYLNFIDLIKTRPNALKYSGLYSILPESWQKHLESLGKEELRKSFTALKIILREHDMAFADRVLRETTRYSDASSDAILITYKRLSENKSAYLMSMNLPSDLPGYAIDTGVYDTLMRGDVL
jgi:transposase